MEEERSKEWEMHVESHKEHCAQSRDASALENAEVQAILDAVGKDLATDEDILKLARYLAYGCVDDLTDELVEAGVKICAAVENLDAPLCEDMKTSICINAFESELLCDSLVEKDWDELTDWADVPEVRDYIYYNCHDEILKECALNGNQCAFDILCYDGFECLASDNEGIVTFCVECEKKGINTYHALDWLSDRIEYDGSVVECLALLGAYDYLKDRELATYSWIEEYFEEYFENRDFEDCDDVAEIASQHLEKVFEYKEDFQWLKKMADAKVPQAQYLLGLLYLGAVPGIVNENKSLALRYINAAKVGGCELADAKLEELDAKEQEAKARAIQEKQQQELRKQKAAEEAAMMKQRIQSAEKEELTAEETLELAYYLGAGNMPKGIKKNANKATKLFKIAAKKGSTEAEYRLGMRLIEGEGCRKNWNAGMKCMRKAAQANYIPAQEYIEEHDTSINRLIHKFIK